MAKLIELPQPRPRTGVVFLDPEQIAAIGPLDTDQMLGFTEPHRWVYLRSGTMFAVPDGLALRGLLDRLVYSHEG